MCKNFRGRRMSLEEYIEKEYESEFKYMPIDMGYMADSELEYDKSEARQKYWDMEIDKFYK